MVNKVLFEHEAPSLDNVKESLFEWLAINSEPVVKHLQWVDLFTFLIDLLIGVNLREMNLKIY